MTTSGYPRIVKEWKRGTPLAEAVVVFEGQPSDMGVAAGRDLTPGFERDFVIRTPTFWTSEYFLRRDGKLIKIEKPDDARASLHREWLLLRLRSNWTVDGKTYPAGALIATDLEAYLKGTQEIRRAVRADRAEVAGRIQPDATPHLAHRAGQRAQSRLCHDAPGRAMAAPAPARPRRIRRGERPCGRRRGFRRLLSGYDGFPDTRARWRSAPSAAVPPQTLKQLPAFFDAKGLTIAQHEAVSKDGTRVPYFQVARTDLAADGKNPTLLYGYGGFEIPIAPRVPAQHRGGLAREGWGLRRGQHPRRRRIRAQVAPGRPQGESPQGL